MKSNFLPPLLTFLALVVLPQRTEAQSTRPEWTHLSTTTDDLSPSGTEKQVGTLIFDIDRDGFNDFVVATYEGMVWYRFDPTARSWTKFALENGAPGVRIEAGGDFTDIDGDGDLDIVQGAHKNGAIWWWENPSPNFSPNSPWKRHLALELGGQHHDQIFGDFDSDGVEELVFYSKGMILAEIASPPTDTWTTTRIGDAGKEGLTSGDVNGDGKLDIIGGGRWYEHVSGTKFITHNVDTSYGNSRSAVGDIIPGGYLEIVIGSGDTVGPLNLYQWNGNEWVSTTLIDTVDHGHALQVGDINGDGHLDIFTAEMRSPGAGKNCQTYILYGDGKGGFDITTLSTGIGGHESKIGDLDGDGDIDILQKDFAAEKRLDIWLNNKTRPSRSLDDWTYIEATKQHARVFGLTFGDVTGDGRTDIVSGRYVYVNPGGDLTGKWEQIDLGSVDAFFVVDVDGDAFPDIVSYSKSGLFWHEAANVGGTSWNSMQVGPAFGLDHKISAQGYGMGQIVPGGRPELVINPGQLVYFEIPSDPASGNWPSTLISTSTGGEGMAVADVDRDGNADVFSRLGGGNAVWWQNPGPDAGGWTSHVIGTTPNAIDRVVAADLNGDSRVDMLVSEENLKAAGAGTYWFEQPVDPMAHPWTRHEMTQQASTHNLDAADLDADGDVDVVTGEHKGDLKVVVWENDGTGAFTSHPVDKGKESHLGTRLADLDGDGDMDIVSIAWTDPEFIHIWRNDGGVPAARNRPGLSSKDAAPVIEPPGGTSHGGATGSDRSGISKTPETTAPSVSEPIDESTALVAHWRLDEQDAAIVRDAVGSHDGKIVGATTETGKRGNALRFDGVDDYVNLGAWDVKGQALTICAWIRADHFDHLSSHDARILSKAMGDREQDHFWMLSTIKVGGATRLRFRLKTNSSTKTLIASQDDMTTNEWIHVAAVYDGTAMILYKNGVEVGRTSKSGPLDSGPGATVWIGGNPPDATGHPFSGLLDEIRIYARALTAEQLAFLATSPPLTTIHGRGGHFEARMAEHPDGIGAENQ